MTDNSFDITLNGEPLTLAGPTSIAELVSMQALAGKRIAVERNEAVLPKSLHVETFLQHNDRIEIIHAVGGG